MLMNVHNDFNYCYFDTYGAVSLKYVAEVFSVEVFVEIIIVNL